VQGEVKSPNIFLLPPETTVADAIIHAGGPTDRGDLDRVTLLREGRKLSLALSKNGLYRESSTIESGDQITVAPRRSALSGLSSITPILGMAASILSLIVLSHR
jgi:protein involved in polysaccharide export with SLBB domain